MPLRRQVLVLVAVALAVSGLFGGLDEVAKPDLPKVAEKEKFKAERWNVTVNGAGVLTDGEAFRLTPEKPGNRFLVVGAIIEITSQESEAFATYMPLALRNVSGLKAKAPQGIVPPTRIVLVRDAPNHAVRLHPFLAEELYFFWEQSGDAPVPTQLEIEIYGMTYRVSSVTGGWEWMDYEAKALAVRNVKNLDVSK